MASQDEARQLSFFELEKWVRKPCPEFLLKLYTETKKKEQEKLLRDKTVTFENMICWILHSGRIGGTFSQYSYHGGSGSLKGRAPLMIDASDENNIVAVGNTDLSQEALKHLVENQRVVMAQFVDLPDGRWYCFYRTHRGLAGESPVNKVHTFTSYLLLMVLIGSNWQRTSKTESALRMDFMFV